MLKLTDHHSRLPSPFLPISEEVSVVACTTIPTLNLPHKILLGNMLATHCYIDARGHHY